MTTKFLINRYEVSLSNPRIREIEVASEDECYIVDAAGRRYMKLGDCFDTFDEAKDEWERRCWLALQQAEAALERAEDNLEEAKALASACA